MFCIFLKSCITFCYRSSKISLSPFRTRKETSTGHQSGTKLLFFLFIPEQRIMDYQTEGSRQRSSNTVVLDLEETESLQYILQKVQMLQSQTECCLNTCSFTYKCVIFGEFLNFSELYFHYYNCLTFKREQ